MADSNGKAAGPAKPKASATKGRASPPKKTTRKKGTPGRKPYTPTDSDRMLVRVCKASGYTEERIAAIINFPTGISLSTLRKHYRAELDHGKDAMMAAVIGNLFRMATSTTHKSALGAGVWLTKNQLGWSDQKGGATAEVEVPGADGQKGMKFTLKIADDKPDDGLGNT